MIVFARETFDQCYPDMRNLLGEHYETLARHKDFVPLDVDEAAYRSAEARGALVAMTARDDGKLIGYAVYFTRYHPHYRQTFWATNDIFWVTPTSRGAGVGVRLFRFVEETLRGLGVEIMNTSFKLAHPEAKPILEHLGHEAIETVYQKVLRHGH